MSGQLARVEDPFIVNRLVGLTAAAPVFNPSAGREGQHCTDDGPVIVDGSATKPQPEHATRADPAPVAESMGFSRWKTSKSTTFTMLFDRVNALVSRHAFLDLTA